MLPTSLLAGLLTLALAPAWPQAKPPTKAPEDPAAQFAAALLQVQQTAEKGSFQRAWDGLHELLFKHQAAPYARSRRIEIVDLATRCAFGIECPAPKLADLVSGELVRWDPKSGDFEIRYTTSTTRDFKRMPIKSDSMDLHPARFVDTLTIEVDFSLGFGFGSSGPQIVVGVDTDETFNVNFGEPGAGYDSTYFPPQIVRVKDGQDVDVVDRQKKPAPEYDGKGTLKVTVGAGGVTAYRDGKRILQCKRSTRESGQVALYGVSNWNRVTLKGRIQSSWPQGLIDAATRTAREAFEKRWIAPDHLPSWLFEGAAPSAPAPAASEEEIKARSSAFVAALKQRMPDPDRVTTAEKVRHWKELVAAFPEQPVAWLALSLLQMEAGDWVTAQATCDAALAAGHSSKALESLPELLAKARTGPSFTRAFVHESANYVVKSDIDQATCVEAAKVLEESYRSYRQRLAPVAGVEQSKFRVFLFAGEAGYHAYSEKALGRAPENTAGVYSPRLKQLLIWNLPDRAAMLRTVRHEGFHQYLDRVVPDAPTWFNEGMAEYYELADVYGGTWTEGQVNRDHVGLFRGGAKWMPLGDLFRLEHRRFYGKDALSRYAESWAVIHYLRQGPKEARELFDVFWRALRDGKTAEEATEAAFGDAETIAMIDEVVRLHVESL